MLKTKEELVTVVTGSCTPLVQLLSNFMASPKQIKLVPPSGPLFLVGGPPHMDRPRSWATLFAPWLVNPHTISKTLNTSCKTSRK